MGAVDEAFGQVELASLSQVFRERVEYAFHHPLLYPLLVASMAGLVGWISARQLIPLSACSQDPQDAVEYGTGVSPRSAALLTTAAQVALGEQRSQDFPPLVGQVHSNGRSEN